MEAVAGWPRMTRGEMKTSTGFQQLIMKQTIDKESKDLLVRH
jgi:hypothetical protein